jgi:predicted molibdopterin-dependent oxidoreductase YjgC
MGGLPNVFPSYQPVDNEEYRQKFEAAWQVKLSAKPGIRLMDMTHAKQDSPVRGMFIMGENPMLSDPVLTKVQESLEGLDFLVVSDIFMTETASLADVVFPAASFAEKSGSFTNSERRVQMVRQAIPILPDCRTDADIIMALSGRLGYEMAYDSPAEIMEEIALLAPIYGGMHHDRLDAGWGLQWPCWDRNHQGTPCLHKYYFTRGKGKFVPASHVLPAELPDQEYPFQLLTGRIYHHYHTGTMTRKSDTLNRESREALLQINPDDATSLKIRAGEMVRLTSRRGSIELATDVTEAVPCGSVYTTFHFSEAPINLLTIGAKDKIADCPEFKLCAARIDKV